MMSLNKSIKIIRNREHNLKALDSIANNFNYDLDNIYEYHSSIGNTITPLVYLPDLAKRLGVKNIILKDDSQRMGLKAFKALGASYAMGK